MNNVLVVIDMQNDFIDGSLGSKEAVAIVPNVVEKVKNFNGMVLYTRDTHLNNYLHTLEGTYLPVSHCIKGSHGWQIHEQLECLRITSPIDKNGFGSIQLGEYLKDINKKTPITSITLVGVCTDICVISNAMILKAFLPETNIIVDASCCAGVTKETHKNALLAMKQCQIIIENEEA